MKTRIKELRVTKGMSIRFIANRLGVSSSYISDVENGVIKNPSEDRLSSIAEVLCVSVEELIVNEEENVKPSNKLPSIRKSMGLTQKEFSELIGVSKNALQRYEAGLREPSPVMMYKICKNLDLDICEVFEIEDVKDLEIPSILIDKTLNDKISEIKSEETSKDLNKLIYNKGYIDALNFVLEVLNPSTKN